MSRLSIDEPWYTVFYHHCGKTWDIFVTEVGGDECPICGNIITPYWYEEDKDKVLGSDDYDEVYGFGWNPDRWRT